MNTVVPIEVPADLVETFTEPRPLQIPVPAPLPVGQIAKAIADVMKQVHVVAKNGENSFHRYRYAKMEDILKEITPLLGHNGLVIFQSELARVMFDNENVIAIEYGFSVVHESGEQWPNQLRQTGVSRCRDSKGNWDDKALNKCHTAARKYFLLSLFQIPTGDEADADRGDNDRRRTLPKKDCRDIFERLRGEAEAITDSVELRKWCEASRERIEKLPQDWQDILRERCEEHRLYLRQKQAAQASSPSHDADGVIWEETSVRPATAADKVAEQSQPADDGIPPFLDRRTPGFDPYRWFTELQTGLLNCESMTEVNKLCNEHVTPIKGHVPADVWKLAQVLVTGRLQEFGNAMMAAE